LSGSPFTAPRATNERSWLYRIRPTVAHWGEFEKLDAGLWRTAPCAEVDVPLAPFRWDPIPLPDGRVSFTEGVRTITTAGDAGAQAGLGSHIYLITASMKSEYFYNADAEMLFVPQQGDLRLWTEFGIIDIEPGEIAVIPRGVKLRVELLNGPARGYLCENYGGAFTLPERGPIGANCLANQRDFYAPVAAYEDRDERSTMTVKWGGALWRTQLAHSPLDVVAWHGSYVPYKYDLAKFMTINTVSFDHPDPSIFTVLTSPSGLPGTANVDLAIFPPRWLVAEHSFRPPWFHRNVMSEFMALIRGTYDAKASGFVPGGASLHNCLAAHGPDRDTHAQASSAELTPHYLADTLAFMFETRLVCRPTRFALETPALQRDYDACWSGFEKHFRG
jgi:homogentisate 1,2-dioxygenase